LGFAFFWGGGLWKFIHDRAPYILDLPMPCYAKVMSKYQLTLYWCISDMQITIHILILSVSAFETEFFICGLAPLADQLVSLFFVRENADQMVTVTLSSTCIEKTQRVVPRYSLHLHAG